MKLCFSTENIILGSFTDTCRIAYDYSFDGFEIYDVSEERMLHRDSILIRSNIAEAKRELINRELSIPVITYPHALDSDSASAQAIASYVDIAAHSGISAVCVSIDNEIGEERLKEILAPAVQRAEKQNKEILLETKGWLSQSIRAVNAIKALASSCIGVAWNIRETFFEGGENAETGIKTLGAYIRYVRIGDRKDDVNVLLGEGDLPAESFINALKSLNYESYVCVDYNDEIDDADIILTQFRCFMADLKCTGQNEHSFYRNRSGSGSFPWKKYELLDKSFSELLDDMADFYPDQIAFKYSSIDYTRTYAEFSREVDRTAAAFIAMGVKPGYHVAIWAGNVPEWFLSFWAAVRIGAVLVTVNTAYKTSEIEYLLKQSDTHTLIMTAGYKDSDYRRIMSKLLPELKNNDKGDAFFSAALPFLRNVVTVGCSMEGALTWEEMMEMGNNVPINEVRRRAAAVSPDDVANMQYTSGTTGFPKGVMLTHRNIINNGKIIGDRMDLSTADRMLVQVPMFHCFGMVLTMTSIMTHGGSLYPLPYFSPKSSLECINRENITCFNGVPTMFTAMFAHKDFASTDFSHVRTGIMAGSNCPPELMRRAAAEMGMSEIISVYGQTEASPGCTMGEVNEDLDHRVETVGTAFPGVECKIINPATGRDMPDGCEGEFVARGYNIMKGYYKMPDETAEAIDSKGWLHTGDICVRDADGYYKVTGRLKDMIIRGGENIYPREIEEFYLTHPKVKDVQVVGVPDDVYGEEICAWIILKAGENSDVDEMRKYGINNMAKHKVPRHIIFADTFPMNAAGKVLKYKMKGMSLDSIKDGSK